jgi:hypothetical protein
MLVLIENDTLTSLLSALRRNPVRRVALPTDASIPFGFDHVNPIALETPKQKLKKMNVK